VNTYITIPFSHFCEKGRWALDWCGVPYVERGFLPGLHLRHTKRIGGRTVPVLVRDDGSALTDSTAILHWADAQAPAHKKLLPTDAAARAEADALENELDEVLGPATRLWAYAHGLRNRPMLRAMVAPSFPRVVDRALLALLLPVVGPLIEKQYGATEEAGTRAEGVIVDGFDKVSALLTKRPYLAGDHFGAADLTFAALGGALVLPRENRWLDHEVALPPPMRAFIDRLRATRAGEHAARCYREHRASPPNA
jgi:glutathione S-transferase